MPKPTIKKNAQVLLALARQLAETPGLTWVDANNAIYAPGGPFARLFGTKADRVAYGKTEGSRQIDDLIDSLPEPPIRAEVEQLDPNCFILIPRRRTPSRSGKQKAKA
jgi:hypothetical protein